MAEVEIICGVDEAGRGPLAGPVCAAAVILAPAPAPRIRGLADSKTLDPETREKLAARIKLRAIAWSVAFATVDEIDRLNIRQANLLAMRRAVEALSTRPTLALVDGNDPPALPCAARTIVGGDASHPAISAASILAKVARDAVMVALDAEHPGYGFASHKGYGAKAHLDALRRLGPCPHHRMSFEPVRAAASLFPAFREAS
jgi:ribonuclease HII